MNELAIKINNLSKVYRLGTIGGATLSADIQSWWAKKRGKEDPNTKIGMEPSKVGEPFYALKNVSFEIKKGEAVGIIGSNGAGKSTLLKLLSRVTAPTEGEIFINGRIASMLEVGTGFHPELTGRENIYMNGAILGMTKAEIDSKIENIIDFSECRQFIDTPVKRYSSGMYVKLAFAVAAHLDAEILVMDEVLAVGDMKFQEKCLGKMGDSSHTDGKTVLYVSHNMNTIRQLCTRCIVLNHGTVIYDGDVEEAIQIYLGQQRLSDSVVEIENIKRAPEFAEHSATILRLKTANDSSQYHMGTNINGRLEISSKNDYYNVHLRVIIKNADGTPVTMSTSRDIISLRKNKINEIEFSLDNSVIAPGKYNLSFVLYEVNQYGTDNTLDGVHSVYSYEVVASDGFNNNMEWKNRYWGNVITKDIIVRNI